MLGSGTTGSIIHSCFLQRCKKRRKIVWTTIFRQFQIHGKANIVLKLRRLNPDKHSTKNVRVTNQDSNYYIILGRDVLNKIGMILDTQDKNYLE